MAHAQVRHPRPGAGRLPGWAAFFAPCLLLAAFPSPLPAQPIRTVPFVLQKETHLEEGCFDPCLCPVLFQDDVLGAFSLTFTGWDGGFRVYQVAGVDWQVPSLGREYTGAGEYRIGGSASTPQQRLRLDLSEDGAAPVSFDSGLVGVTVRFPILDIAIARNGFYCHDTAFYVHAAPARPITLGLQVDEGALTWDDYADADGYDVAAGSLGLLLAAGGDFESAGVECIAPAPSGAAADAPSLPQPGEGLWYVVRAHGGVAGSTYDGDGDMQSRDAGIDAAPAACP